MSHHVVEYGQMSFDCFCKICHEKGVAVIVDAASEYDLRTFINHGADVVIYSSHKFLGGPTAGIVAGSSDLIQAGYMQNIGIGRVMKVGKESIFGAIAALQAWKVRDHNAIREKETSALRLWKKIAISFDGVQAEVVDDSTHNPLSRLKISINKEIFKSSAASVATALSSCKIPIIVRDHEIELGYFYLDPCNLADGHAELVSSSLQNVLQNASSARPPQNSLSKYAINRFLNSKRVKTPPKVSLSAFLVSFSSSRPLAASLFSADSARSNPLADDSCAFFKTRSCRSSRSFSRRANASCDSSDLCMLVCI